MSPRGFSRPGSVIFALAVIGWSAHASAHIDLDQAGTHLSRYGAAEIKDAPCGLANGGRGTNVYTYAPGETIEVSIAEYIPHPGYFRIAFDEDGDDDFVDPVSIRPLDPNRPCPLDEFDQCGTTEEFDDFFNTPAVLMDNLDPHVTAELGARYTWEVTLPNVQCDNCTLQIIQVMQDIVHGAYNTDKSIEPGYFEDVYHQCIDLVLDGPLAAAPDSGAMDGSTGPVAAVDGGMSETSTAEGSGCACAVGSRSGRPWRAIVLSALALGLFSRRRFAP